MRALGFTSARIDVGSVGREQQDSSFHGLAWQRYRGTSIPLPLRYLEKIPLNLNKFKFIFLSHDGPCTSTYHSTVISNAKWSPLRDLFVYAFGI